MEIYLEDFSEESSKMAVDSGSSETSLE
jgi:hypothetical protein